LETAHTALVVEAVRKTPHLLWVLIIIVLLAVIIVVTVVAVTKGRAVSILGLLTIDEFHPPEVQKCAFLASTFSAASSIDSDALVGINNQIANLQRQLYKEPATKKADAHSWSVFPDPATDTEDLYKELDTLRRKAEAISDVRLSLLFDLKKSCSP
jgi:hypothetical protein